MNRILEEQYGRQHVAYLHDDPSWSAELLIQKCNDPAARIKAISGHFPFGIHQHITRPCTYITFVRDPIELYLSMYSYIRNSPAIPSHAKVLQLTFRQFMECEQLQHLTRNFQSKYLSVVDGQFVSQSGSRYYDWDPGVHPIHLDRIIHNLTHHFTYVGTTDQFHTSVMNIAKKLHWPHPIHVYHENKSAQRLSRHDLDADTIELMLDNNKVDAQLYDYVRQLHSP